MKRILLNIAVSFATTLLTLGGVFWCLWYHPLPTETRTLADGTVSHTNYWLLRGVTVGSITDKNNHVIKSWNFYPCSPEQTLITYHYYDDKFSRVEVASEPHAGADQRKVYQPESNELLASTSVTLRNLGAPAQKQFFDAFGRTISEEEYKAILNGH